MSTEKKPNIVFFFTDDQRFDTISALGNIQIKTPNIDRLATCGTSFTNAHIPGGTCGAVCMPSRAMLNTGRTLFHLQGAGETIPQNHVTIGEALQNAGYRTFGCGKWHNGTESFNRSFTDGAEIFFGGMADHWNVPACNYDPSAKYASWLPYCPAPQKNNKVSYKQADHIHMGLHSSELVCKAACEWIRDYSDDKPFYAYISFLAPHDPRTMPKKFMEMYDPEKIVLPPNFSGGHEFNNGVLHIRDEELASFPRNITETRQHIAEYYAMITHLDDELGKVIRAIKEKGELENTIFIFAGDNGLALGQHGLFGKQNCYEHSVRVPLIFCGPGIPQNQLKNGLCYLLDIFPTICGLISTDTPQSVEGVNLFNNVSTSDSPIRDCLYFAYCEYQRAIKRDGVKLIEYVVDGHHVMTQLFNLDHDKWEMNNIAKENPQKVASLRKMMVACAYEWGDCESEWGQIFWNNINLDNRNN